MLYTIIAPVYITIPRVTKKDKIIPLSLNWYRNAHHIEANNVKIKYKELLSNQILSLPMFGSILVGFDYYPKTKQRSDLGNWVSISEKFFLDALVELGKLEDDSCYYVPRTFPRFQCIDPKKKGKMIITIEEIFP